MPTVTISPKFQIVIPKSIRESLKLRPGQKMQMTEYGGRIELVPERDISCTTSRSDSSGGACDPGSRTWQLTSFAAAP